MSLKTSCEHEFVPTIPASVPVSHNPFDRSPKHAYIIVCKKCGLVKPEPILKERVKS